MRSWQKLWVILTTFILLALPSPSADPPVNRQGARKNQNKTMAQLPTKVSSLAGCVDERDSGHYVLVDDVKLSPIVELRAEGFPNEGFAKYLGQKVTVRGKSSADDGRAVFTVQKIEIVSDTCTPARPSP